MNNSRKVFVLVAVLGLSLLLSSCFTTLNIGRFPPSITKGTAPSGPNQWYARTALTNEASQGVLFRYVVWLHVPEDWTLPWARQFSFTGDFQNTTLSQNAAAQTFIETSGNCGDVGGAAASGYKWRAWQGPVETMPANGSSRFTNYTNLRGGLGVPSGETSDTYGDVRMVIGVMYDVDADDVLDTYNCNAGMNTMIVVP